METQLEIQPHQGGRTHITILLTLNEEEQKDLAKSPCERHLDSETPLPFPTYTSPNPNIRALQGLPLVDGTPQKCYFLKAARKVPLNRPIPGKTHLRLPISGTVELGYLNPNDIPRFTQWWKTTAKNFAETLRENLYKIAPTHSFTPEEKKTLVQESHLNPINPNENKGARKRGFDVY